MKTLLKKIPAALLALVIVFSSVLPASAVAMPAGYTPQQVEASIPKAEKLVETLLNNSEDIPDIGDSVYKMLFSDATLNDIFSGIYSAFTENESTLSSLGIDMSVQNVAQALIEWPSVYNELNGKSSWDEVLQNVDRIKWNVRSRASFAGALAGMLSPLNALMYALLCSGTYRINALLYVDGADGYNNALVPLLKTMGCPSIMTQEEFTSRAKENYFFMVRDFVFMLLDSVDSILKTPVESLCTYLPGIAYYLNNGGLSETLKTLMEPLSLRIAIFSLPGINSLLENTDMFSSGVDIKSLLEKADLSGITGSQTDFKLPDMDLEAVAACGTMLNGVYTPDRAQAFVVIMNWLIDAVKLNRATISAQIPAIGSFLDKSNDEILALLLKILNLKAAAGPLEYVWTFPSFAPGKAVFTPNLTRENFERVLERIDPTVDEFLVEFTEQGSLSDLIRKNVYSNKLVSELTKSVYSALYTSETADLLSSVGISASPAGVAEKISRSYPSAAKYLSSFSSWDKINTGKISWGFSDGSKDGFVYAVTAVLRPFATILRYLLAEGSINAFDVLSISGSNGYNTAVIPLLEGLGCARDDIMPYTSYKASSDSALITNILDPVTSLLDKLCEKPIDTLCEILPNIVYFLGSDMPSQCISNLIYPVRKLLEELGMQDMLPAELTNPEKLDLDKLMSTVTENSGLGISLSAADLAKAASLGTAETRESRRTVNGAPAAYTYIAADKPAVLAEVLRYAVTGIKESGNNELLSSFSMSKSGTDSSVDMMSVYTEKVTQQLESMTADETIEWLYDLLFAETPKREEAPTDGYIPTVIYEEQEDHTVRNRAVIAVAALIAVAGLIVFFVKFDFADAKEKRKRKKSLRKKQRPASAPVPPAQSARQPERYAAPPAERVKRPVERYTAPPADRIIQTERHYVSPAEGKNQSGQHTVVIPPNPVLSDQEVRRAYKETKKADRYYRQAMGLKRRKK